MNKDTSSRQAIDLHQGDALIVVDMQRDFLPGGALAVPQSDEVVPVINAYIKAFTAKKLPIVFSRDWHPTAHCSFAAQGGPWPPHCVAGSAGAEFAAGLTIPANARIVSKAMRPNSDAYSAFQETGLQDQLRRLGVTRVFIGGLATDYCVQATAQDALAMGFTTVILHDAIRAVRDGAAALQTLLANGAGTIRIEALTNNLTPVEVDS